MSGYRSEGIVDDASVERLDVRDDRAPVDGSAPPGAGAPAGPSGAAPDGDGPVAPPRLGVVG